MRDYDEWKLMTPEEDYGHKHIISGGMLCPFCPCEARPDEVERT